MPKVSVSLPATELYDQCNYTLDIPTELGPVFEGAVFLGRGASSAAWRLAGGDVLKITPDPAVRDLTKWQHEKKTPNLVQIKSCGLLKIALSEMAHNEDAWEEWSFSIQPFYHPIAPSVWDKISGIGQDVGQSERKSRPGWCRTKDGLMAHGLLARKHVDALTDKISASGNKHSALGNAFKALSSLSSWLNEYKCLKAGLDIDKQENWGMDENGKVVLVDPVYANDTADSTCHWNAEYY